MQVHCNANQAPLPPSIVESSVIQIVQVYTPLRSLRHPKAVFSLILPRIDSTILLPIAAPNPVTPPATPLWHWCST